MQTEQALTTRSAAPSADVCEQNRRRARLERARIEELATEITELAGHINAATCRFLVKLAEFDRLEGWAHFDCASCAHWVMWRCGLGRVAATDHVRVARRIAALPTITDSFARGELSYSQVRALARIATPDTEAELLGWARHATATQIEIIARTYHKVLGATDLAETNRRHHDRYLRYFKDDYGCFVIAARLDPEEGEVVAKALEAAVTSLERDERADEDDSAESGAEPENRASGSLAETADDSAESLPESQRDDREGAPPYPAACFEHRSWGRANADAVVALAETFLETGPQARSGGDRYQVVVHVDADSLAGGAMAGTCGLDDGTALHPETVRRLACDASIVTMLERDGNPLDVGRKTRSIPSALARALRSRDKHCRFPGCTHKSFTDAHHIHHWTKGGETKLANLATLCRFHHRKLHEGRFRIERTEDGSISFVKPDGSIIETVPLGPIRGPDLMKVNRELDLDIDPDTCVTRWYGDSLTLSACIDALLQMDRKAGPRVDLS
jgi:hypothetical protein